MSRVPLTRLINFLRSSERQPLAYAICAAYNRYGASRHFLSTSDILRIALGSDERSHLTDFVGEDLRRRGMELDLFGPIGEGAPGGATEPWPDVARNVAEQVASGNADCGVLFCWTGTGVSIAANKVAGVRAALCRDAETARGARAWNEANVLCLSLRATPEVVAKEILDAWFSASPDPSEAPNIEKVKLLEREFGPSERSQAGVRESNSGG